MLFFKKKVGQRRLEVRRGIPPARAALWQRFCDAGGITAALMAAGMFVVILAMDVWPLDPLPWRTGQYVPADIHSRVDLKVLDHDKLESRREDAAKNAPASFRLDYDVVDRVADELRKLPERLKAASQPANVDKDLRDELGLTGQNAAATLAAWRACGQGGRRARFYEQVESLRDALADCWIVSAKQFDHQWNLDKKSVQVVAGRQKFSLAVQLSQLISADGDKRERISRAAGKLAEIFDAPIRESVRTYLTKVLSRQPLYVYDEKATRQLAARAVENVNDHPPQDCYNVYPAGRKIVDGGAGRGPKGLKESELALLQLEQDEYMAARGLHRFWKTVQRIAMRGVILLLIVVLVWSYIAACQPRVLKEPLRAVALSGTILLILAANKIIVSAASANPYTCVLAVLMAVVVLTIAYDQRFALGLGAIISAVVVLQIRADFEMFIILAIAVGATAGQLEEIRTRSKLIKVLGVSALLVVGVTWCFGLFAAVPLRFVFSDSLWAGLSAVLVGFLALGLMPLIERVFRTATSMTLLEWCDASKPLMRRLAMEAPGTHNHSLQLGTMCEAAAEAIGARGLLARVGAYYHDIGKIHKSEYFTENQGAAASKHAKLSPAMSLLIIIAHVKDGVELAREYGLPRVLHEFIETHHGTTLVQYFYHAAAEQRKGDCDRAPDEVEFRYPGPKPRSSEAAILMLADASESSVRAMSEPTPGRIENQVHAMVSRRLMDGQLDDCDLTLRQVHQIEVSIVKCLCGIYHSRISYPAPPGEKPAASETPAAADANNADDDEGRRG